jgi:hypothetical protein
MIRRLKDLVAPLSEREFLDSFLRKDRLVVKTTEPRHASSLLPWATINHLIDAGGMPPSNVRVYLKSRNIPELMYRRGEEGRLCPNAFHQLVAQGVSIMLISIDDYVPAIATLADSIERRIGHKVWVNCYITFGKTSALKPHYDDHDVLAVQIHGAKRWRGYGIPIAYPVTTASIAFDVPVWEEFIEPGDVLYVPRGEAHDTIGEVTPSVHLTFGILAPNGIDLLNWVAKRAQTDAVFRMDVTRVAGEEALHSHELAFKRRLHDLIDQLSFNTYLDEADQQRPSRVRVNLGFDGVLRPDVWLAPTPKRPIALALNTEGEAEATIGGRAIRLPANARRALQVLLEEDGLSFATLAGKLATPLEDRGLYEAVAQLLAKGLCAIEPR